MKFRAVLIALALLGVSHSAAAQWHTSSADSGGQRGIYTGQGECFAAFSQPGPIHITQHAYTGSVDNVQTVYGTDYVEARTPFINATDGTNNSVQCGDEFDGDDGGGYFDWVYIVYPVDNGWYGHTAAYNGTDQGSGACSGPLGTRQLYNNACGAPVSFKVCFGGGCGPGTVSQYQDGSATVCGNAYPGPYVVEYGHTTTYLGIFNFNTIDWLGVSSNYDCYYIP